MNILGISCHYHEAAAALIVNGKIVAAAEEERFTRIKHDATFPENAIEFCLNQINYRHAELVSASAFKKGGSGIRQMADGMTNKLHDLDYVVFYEKPFVKFERNLSMSLRHFPRSRSLFVESMRNFLTEKLWIKSTILSELNKHKLQHRFVQSSVKPDQVLFVPHHLSHAAASFYASPFGHAAFLTLDAVGEWSTGSWGIGKGHLLTPLFELQFPHSIGMWYSAFTALLGFEVNDGEYKVMGMAGYGKARHKDLIKKTIRQLPDGSIALNLEYFEFHHRTRRMYTKLFESTFGDIDKFDLAASLQSVTEEIILNMMNIIQRKTKETNLVYGGGVALNSVVNGLILRNTKFKDVFIFPAAGDDGGAVGAALYVYHHVLGNKKRHPLKDMFLGQSLTASSRHAELGSASQGNLGQILKHLPASALHRQLQAGVQDDGKVCKKMSDDRLFDFVTAQLIAGKVIGWFEGRAEFGPRALGHRSIIADPINPKMKDIVNEKVKFREEFRPFAPVVLEESVSKYFELEKLPGMKATRLNKIPGIKATQFRESYFRNLIPFMLATVVAKPSAQKIAPAVVHVDGTSRIQIVSKKYEGRYRKLLEIFYKKTKRPILLNTSFNLKGEPIVNSPKDAYKTFMKSGIDVLVIENYVITKK